VSKRSGRVNYRDQRKATSATPLGTDACLEAGALPGMWGFDAGLSGRFRQSVDALYSAITSVYECLAIGIGLGILGAAVVACAIPILLCISPLSP
jgi:hypothetical protein